MGATWGLKLGVESARTWEDLPSRHQDTKKSREVMRTKRNVLIADGWLLLMGSPWCLCALVVICLAFDSFRQLFCLPLSRPYPYRRLWSAAARRRFALCQLAGGPDSCALTRKGVRRPPTARPVGARHGGSRRYLRPACWPSAFPRAHARGCKAVSGRRACRGTPWRVPTLPPASVLAIHVPARTRSGV